MRLLLLVLVVVAFCSAKNWYVRDGATGGDGSEEAPFGDFQTAFNASGYRDTILGAPGNYPSQNNRGLVLGDARNVSVIAFGSSGEGMVVIDFSDNEGTTPFLTWDPLTTLPSFEVNISHFKFTGQQEGNIVSLPHGAHIIENCIFEKNLVKGGHCFEATTSLLEMSYVDFTENGQGSNGPAIFLNNTSGVILNTTFQNHNHNVDNKNVLGGALYMWGGEFAFQNCTFFDNMGGKGGGIYAEEAAILHILNGEFNTNYGAYGGAIASNSATIEVTSTDFLSNSATSDGGAIYQDGPLYIDLSTFVSNSAGGYGGAVFTENVSKPEQDSKKAAFYQTVRRSTFLQNVADYGGGLAVGREIFNLVINCTFDHNANHRDDGKGPAIYVSQSSTVKFTSILVIVKEDSTNVLGAGLYVEGGLFSKGSVVELGGTWEVLRSDSSASLYDDLYFSNVSVVSFGNLPSVNLTYNSSLTFCAFITLNHFEGATLTNGNLYLQTDLFANYLTWIAGDVGAVPQSASCIQGANGFSMFDDGIDPVQLTVGDGKIESVPLKTVNSYKIDWVFSDMLLLEEYTEVNVIEGSVKTENEMVLHSGALIGDPYSQNCSFSASNLTLYDDSVVYGDVILDKDINLYFSVLENSAAVKGKLSISSDSLVVTHYSDLIVPVEEGKFEVLSWTDYKGNFAQSYADYTDSGLVLTYFSYSHDGFYQIYSQVPPSPPPQGKKGKLPAILVFSALLILCFSIGLAWFITYRKRQPSEYATIQGDY